MEHKYKLTDPKANIFDPKYKELGPLWLVAVLLEWNSNLLPIECGQFLVHFLSTSNGGGRKCYLCQHPGHLANRCPQRNNDGTNCEILKS